MLIKRGIAKISKAFRRGILVTIRLHTLMTIALFAKKLRINS